MPAAADSPPPKRPRCSPASAGVQAWPWILVFGITLALLYAALSHRLLGPVSSHDDRLIRAALSPEFDAKLYFSYVHVWTLKAILYGFPDRRLAGAVLGAASSAALVLASFGLSRHLLGTAWGLLTAALMFTFSPLLAHLTVPTPYTAAAAYGALALWTMLIAAGDCDKPARSAEFSPLSRRQQLGMALAGFLCFASARSHVTGIAILPVLAVSCAELRDSGARGWVHRWRPLWLLLGGIVAGQLMLSLAEALALADPIASLRAHNLSGAGRYLRGGPFRSMSRTHPIRSPFILALEQHGVREWAVAGMLGTVLTYRSLPQALGKRAIAMWLILSLPMLAWVYPHERARELNFAATLCLAPGLAIALTLFIRKLWEQPGPARQEFPLLLALAIAAIACTIGVTGIGAELAIVRTATSDYATGRSAMFFFTLAVPVCAAAAALLRPRWLRIIPIALTTGALLLCGARPAQDRVARQMDINKRWSAVAHAGLPPSPSPDTIPHIAVWHLAGRRGSIRMATIQNRLVAISPWPFKHFAVRRVLSADEVNPGDLLVIDRGDKKTAVHRQHIRPPASHRYLTNLKSTNHVVQVFAPRSKRGPHD